MDVLTHDIELVGVVNAAILILHNAGVVAFIRRHYRVHDDTPGGITDLRGNMPKGSIESLEETGRSPHVALAFCGTGRPICAQSALPGGTARLGPPTPSLFTL